MPQGRVDRGHPRDRGRQQIGPLRSRPFTMEKSRVFFVIFIVLNMSRIARKSVFVASDEVRHKPGCTVTEDGNFEYRKKRDCTICIGETMALNSFVFAY